MSNRAQGGRVEPAVVTQLVSTFGDGVTDFIHVLGLGSQYQDLLFLHTEGLVLDFLTGGRDSGRVFRTTTLGSAMTK